MPAFTGTRVVEPDLATLREYIDWQFFFHAWELKGRFPAILERPEARELYDDAQELLDEIVRDGSLTARGVYGFWPAHADGDDVVLDEGTRFSFLRQQSAYGDSRPNRSLADYVAPEGDHLGAFAVGIHGADELAARFEAEHDDYRAIMAKALADRLAEAFAEWLHAARAPRVVRAGERPLERGSGRRALSAASARRSATRPARTTRRSASSSTCSAPRPRASSLTETFAMLPAAAVAGVYFAHPAARYFSVGRVGRDQVADYAARKGWEVAEAERWLGPNLAYTPDALTPA